ncbi:DUF4169 family protein [Thalassobaculum sp.]|uniref:DUF4169 family protein n=1 Tax=Thalassobaculum sp. TaxID=2022740 RepID=UPI003B599FE6
MSGKIVNLRTERKRRDRADAAEKAAQNRALHGRTKTERRHEEARRDAAQRAHDGRRIDPEDDRSDPA